MNRTTTDDLARAVRRVVEDERAKARPDHELLLQFVGSRDESAFHALLRRHGPMVLAVCRSLLADEADAEDAFQATFLIFAGKADSIRKAASLGSWLHGVAYRTARKAREAFARRQLHERIAARPEESIPADLTWSEVQELLHEELSRLSDRARIPLVLCYLQGKTLDEAAKELGTSKSTLKVRLERARALLRARLERRGIGPNAVLLVAAMPAATTGELPGVLLGNVGKAALALAAGRAAGDLTSPRVAALVEGASNALLVTQRKILVAALTALLLFGVSLAGLLLSKRDPWPVEAAEPNAIAQEDGEKNDAPAPVGPPKEVATLKGHANSIWSVALTADGRTVVSASFDKTVKVWDVATKRERLTLRGHTAAVEFVAVSADGKTVASADQHGFVKVWDLATGRARITFANKEHRPNALFLTPDGRTLTAGWMFRVKLWDLTTGREVAYLKFPEGSRPAVRRGGKLMVRGEHGVNPTTLRLYDLPSGQLRAAWKQNDSAQPLTLSADGKTLFTMRGRPNVIQLLEVASGKVRATTQNLDQSHIDTVAIHPHGRFLAIPREDVNVIRLIDLATCEPCANLPVKNDEILSMAFSADGNTFVASEGPDSAIRVWDVGSFVRARPRLKATLASGDLESTWADLAGDDAAKAYRAIWTLAGAPRQAAAWIRSRILPVVAAEEKVTSALLAGLNHDRQAERDQAMRALDALGESAWPALEKARTSSPSAEVRRRVAGLVETLERAERSPEHLLVVRAIEALELAATREARQALRHVAGGTPLALRTREARAALDRLARR